MSIGKILRAKREDIGLTQDELAEMTGISKPYLSAIETERVKNPPSEDKLRRLEEALQFAPGQLLRLARLTRSPMAVREELERLRAENRRFRSLLGAGAREASPPEELPADQPDDLTAAREAPTPSPRQTGEPMDAGVWVPVINRVAAGYPAWHGDLDYPPGVADDYVRCPDLHDPQAFAARVSGDSMEPKFREGDIVIFSPAAPVADGDDCFVRRADTHETTFKRIFFQADEAGAGQIRLQPRNEKYPPQVLHREQVNGLYKAVFRVERLG